MLKSVGLWDGSPREAFELFKTHLNKSRWGLNFTHPTGMATVGPGRFFPLSVFWDERDEISPG